jgi:hypothetical protein
LTCLKLILNGYCHAPTTVMRLDAPGALQAVIICGIARKAIFKDDTVREEFMKRMH